MECVKCKKTIPEDGLFCPYCGKRQVPEKRKTKKRANGMGSVIKKPGQRTRPWEAQKAGVYIGCYATRHEAEQALLRLADTPITETLNMTFEQVYNKWLPEHSRNITDKGMEGYKNAYKHCAPLYNKIFRKLRTSDFQSVIMQMEDKGLSKASCAKVVQLFGQLSKWAIREEICHTNYAPFVTITVTDKSEKTPFTQDQIKAIQSAKSPAADIALIMLATGCRPNELFSVTIENCKKDYFISGSKTEAGRNRAIPVSEIGIDAYKKMRALATEKGYSKLIDAYPGNRSYANFAKRDWKELMGEVKIEGMTPYNCRHTYATLAVQAGVKPEILQKILGHADYSTTIGVYTHLDIVDILKEAEKLTVAERLQTNKKEVRENIEKSSENAEKSPET